MSNELTVDNISPLQKAALVLVAVGIENASEILQNFSDKEVENVSIEIAKLKNISADVLNIVMEEYYEMILANKYIVQGGIKYAKDVLEKAWGRKKAEDKTMICR